MTPEDMQRLLHVVQMIDWFVTVPAEVIWIVMSVKQGRRLLDTFPIGPIAVVPSTFIQAALKVALGLPAWSLVLLLALNAYIIYRYIKNNKNDRWKRFKKRVGERIKAMNGRLIVVPVRS